MATSPSVFPFAHIALTAVITAVVALLMLVILRPRFKMLSLVDCLLVAVVVGISVIVWRSAGNTGALNNDPIPPVSPNDVLCPLVTYLFIGFYAAFRPPLDAVRFEQVRVLLTLVSFIESAGDDLTRRKENSYGKQTDAASVHSPATAPGG
jgi:hypothetical protein